MENKTNTTVSAIGIEEPTKSPTNCQAPGLNMHRHILKEPALCIYDRYVYENGFPFYFMEDFTAKKVFVIGEPSMGCVYDMCADQKGNIYAVEKNCVVNISKRKEFTGPLKEPKGIACDRLGRIYITDAALGQVIRIDDLDGTNLVKFGCSGHGISEFSHPHGIAIDKSGRIYIADTGNERIVRIDNMDGDGWTSFDGHQYASLGLRVDRVYKIAVDSQDRIYYVKPSFWTVARIDDMEGSNIKSFGGALDEIFQRDLANPTDIAIDQYDRIYISDIDLGRIVRIDDIEGNGFEILDRMLNLKAPFRMPCHIAVV